MTRLFYVVAPICTLVIIYASLMDMSGVPVIDVPNVDKAYHGAAYFKLTIAWYLFFYKRFLDRQPSMDVPLLPVFLTWSPTIAIGASVICLFIGGLLELVQEWFTENRTMDSMDLMANASGIVIAVGVIWGVSYLYQRISKNQASNP